MSKVVIKYCGKCDNEFQDSQYGKGNRVHNESGIPRSEKIQCTGCVNPKDKRRFGDGFKGIAPVNYFKK